MIFVDTSFIVALLLTNDRNNQRANEVIALIENENLIINNTVLTETVNFFSKCKNVKQGHKIKDLVDILINSCDVYYLTNKDYSNSIETYIHYNGAVNFSDCTILKTMENLNITEIVSFDGDFDTVPGIKRIC